MVPSARQTALSAQARAILQVLLVIAGVAFGVWVLHRLTSVVLVLMVAALVAYVVAPLADLAERPVRLAGRRRRLSRGVAIVLVYVLLLGGAAGGAVLLLPSATRQVNEMIASAPAYTQSVL